jgi:ABC-type oligopeptide transport system ATPase subunit
MSAPAMVEVRNLTKEFRSEGGDVVRAVDDVSFAVQPGETFGLAGISGSGKSVIGRVIVSLMKPTAGEVLFEGKPIAGLPRQELMPVRARMQMVFQNPLAALNPRKTAGSSLDLPLKNFGMGSARERRERIGELLNMVGLSPRHAQYYPHEFSGGQCQRLGIARALASNPRFIFLDEPVSALDVSIQAQMLNLLKELQERLGLTYLFVANNLNVLYFVSNRIAVLHQGRLIEVQDAESLFRAPQQKLTRDLLSAIVLYEGRRPARPREATPANQPTVQ